MNEPPGLYIHIPFCSGKCIYCDFFSIPSSRLISHYLESLKLELDLTPALPQPFDTLYIGGGTPSRLSESEMAGLIELIRDKFAFTDDFEITVELNPEDVTAEWIAEAVSVGVSRFSLGIQSLNDDWLAWLGRRCDVTRIYQAIEIIRAAGIDSLSLDMIYGLPDQSVDLWLVDLDRLLEFAPEHLSCYQLTNEPRTSLARMIDQGRAALPGDDESRQLFMATSRHLQERGYIHYEISNFARSKDLKSRHNLKYWRHTPYIGLGPSAHSFVNDERWWNHRSLKMYNRFLEHGQLPRAGQERLSLDALILEKIFLGVRTNEGVQTKIVTEQGCGMDGLKKLKEQGLVICQGDRIIPTLEGMLVADALALELSG